MSAPRHSSLLNPVSHHPLCQHPCSSAKQCKLKGCTVTLTKGKEFPAGNVGDSLGEMSIWHSEASQQLKNRKSSMMVASEALLKENDLHIKGPREGLQRIDKALKYLCRRLFILTFLDGSYFARCFY